MANQAISRSVPAGEGALPAPAWLRREPILTRSGEDLSTQTPGPEFGGPAPQAGLGHGAYRPVYSCSMESQRFHRPIIVTDHARRRIEERGITDMLLLDLIETGELRHNDEIRVWIAKHYADRNDNLLCIAAALESALIVKMVMHHFTWEPLP